MKKLSNQIKSSSIWIIIILIAIISIVVFLYLPFQISLFPENPLKKVYFVENISEAHQTIINKFNEKYKGQIEVVPVNLPFYHFTTNDRKAILTRSLRNRSDGIDIFTVDLIWVPRFAKWGYSLNDEFGDDVLSKINKNVLNACYSEDSLVAFPLFLDLGVMYYRKDLLNKLPDWNKLEIDIQNSLTWNEFIDLGKRMKKYNYPFYVFTGGDFEGLMCCYHEMLSDKESEEIFNNNPINLNSSASNKVMQMMVDFIYKYKFSPYEVTGFDEFNSYIYTNNKDAVFLRGWVGYHRQYREFLQDTTKIQNLELAPLPHFEGNNSSGVFGGWSLMISKYSNRKEEALKFIKFVFEEENQKILYEKGGVLPVNMNVYSDSVYLSAHKELGKIQKLLKWGKHRPFLTNYTRLSEIMSKQLNKALKKEITVTEALNNASEQINSEKINIK